MRRRTFAALLAAAVAAAGAAAAAAARAEVTEAQDWGFQSRHQLQVAAPPERVWAALVQPARWWNPSHTWFGKAEALSLDPTPGGCFCETGPDGAGARHLEVLYVAPGRSLHLWGPLGPLHTEGVGGGLVVELKPADGGTQMTVTYTVGGFARGGLKPWASPVDGVLGEQFGRLARLVETGKPA